MASTAFKQRAASVGLYLIRNRGLFKRLQLVLHLAGTVSSSSQAFLWMPWHLLTGLESLVSNGMPLSTSSIEHAQHWMGEDLAGWLPTGSVAVEQTAGAAAASNAPPGTTAAAQAEAAAAAVRALSTAGLAPSATVSSQITLGGLTALSSLQLRRCSIEGCCDYCAWLASQPAKLTGLRTWRIDLQDIEALCTSALAAALASRLQQLTKLTQLTVGLD
jgi:hypothetical protein